MLKTEHYTLVSGLGYGDTALNALDNALCCAGVGDYNLIKVSSIWPPMSNEEKMLVEYLAVYYQLLMEVKLEMRRELKLLQQ